MDIDLQVMFRVYGGPNSRLVDNRFSVDWSDVLASQYGVVVVVADGQGTVGTRVHVGNTGLPSNANRGIKGVAIVRLSATSLASWKPRIRSN